MATEREIQRAVKAADRRAKAKAKADAAREKSISTRVGEGRSRTPEDCCTPKMAGQVLSRLGAKARKAAAEERRRIRVDRASAKRPKKAPVPSGTNSGGACACEAPKSEATMAKEPARPMVPAPSSSPLIRIDYALRDLKATATDGYIERKHVAKALRRLLQARYRGGFSVTTPNHSMATTLDVEPKGASTFTDAHRASLIDIFDSDPGNSGQFMVLVSPFVSDSSSIPTGIRSEHVDEFRRLMAKAAGLPAPKRYEDPAAPAPPPPSMFEPLTDGELEQLGALMLQSLKKRGVTARMKVPTVGRIDGTVLIQGKDASIELRRNPRGFHARPLTGANTPEVRTMIEVLERDAAPVFGQKPHQGSGQVPLFTALHPEKRKANCSRAAKDWMRKNINVEQFDDAPAANEKPSRLAVVDASALSEAEIAKEEPRRDKTLAVGREDYEERRERRADRLRERSLKAAREAQARRDAAFSRLPSGSAAGEPIKVGHHSERRHRRDIERSENDMRKSFEASKKSQALARRAAVAEANTSISSDDPNALDRLRERLAELEASRDETKRLNALARAGKLPDSENPENPPHMQSFLGKRRYPMPSYGLKNTGAEIRRLQERIEQLSTRQGRVAREVERGGVRIVENGDINRLQVFTEGKPPEENRTWLKRHGFRWARSEGAWQRQIGDSSWNLGLEYLDTFVEKRDDTPFQSVEAPKSKPNYTDQDLAFWRDEFAKLDEEFPGDFTEGYDDAWEALKASLRTRKSGDPQGQASAYVQYRLGNWSVEEAVKNLYFGRRYAKPKPRPKRSAKATSSTMSVDAFLAAVTEGVKGLPGQLRLKASSLGGRDSAHVSHYNIPEGSRDEAKTESNRLSLLVNGWERDGAPPRSGKVKLEVLVSSRLRGLRGRTTTPEKMVGVVVEILRRHAALRPS